MTQKRKDVKSHAGDWLFTNWWTMKKKRSKKNIKIKTENQKSLFLSPSLRKYDDRHISALTKPLYENFQVGIRSFKFSSSTCLPELLLFWPCLTQEANDWWKFLSCWKETGEPSLEARTILVPVVTWPALWPVDVGVMGVLAEVVVIVAVEVVAVVLGLCCSRRF